MMKTAMVVEDEDNLRRYYSVVLERLGFNVLTAEDGDIALKLMEGNPAVDLVILDLKMKRLGGKDAYPRLKAIKPALKVIVSSAYVHDKDEEELMRLGVDAVLKKPFRMLTFKETICRVTEA